MKLAGEGGFMTMDRRVGLLSLTLMRVSMEREYENRLWHWYLLNTALADIVCSYGFDTCVFLRDALTDIVQCASVAARCVQRCGQLFMRAEGGAARGRSIAAAYHRRTDPHALLYKYQVRAGMR